MTTPTLTLGNSYRGLASGTIRDKFVLVEGRRGTGKTRAILTILLARALAVPKSRILVVRSTRTRLSATVLVTLEEQVFPSFGMSVPGGGARENRSGYRLPNGSEIVVQGLDDTSRTQSGEFSWIYVAEGTELASQNDVSALAGALRLAMPQDVPSFVPRHQCIIDFNPSYPGHWINKIGNEVPTGLRKVNSPAAYRRILAFNRQDPEPGRWRRIVTCHADNPYYWDSKAWTWTPQGLEYYTETLSHLTGHLKRNWLDGEWSAPEGTVWGESFLPELHEVNPFRIPSTWPIYAALDPGYGHNCAFAWFAVAPNGRMYCIAEIVGARIPLGTLIARIEAMERENGWTVKRYYGDPQYIHQTRQETGKNLRRLAAELGLRLTPWPATGDMDAMVEAVRHKLEKRLDDGGPALVFFRNCPAFIEGMQGWSLKPNQHGQFVGDDKYQEELKDQADVVRGIVAVGLKYEPQQAQAILGASEQDDE